MITSESLINTSVEDCAITLKNWSESDPARALQMITESLQLMNSRQLDHRSRRNVMIKEAKRAITKLGERQ